MSPWIVRRSPLRRNIGLASLTLGLLILPLGIAPAALAAGTQPFPDYSSANNPAINGSLRGDIAGSAFVDNDGAFHWISSYSGYNNATDTSTTNSRTKTFTNSDLGTVNSGIGNTTTVKDANTHMNLPGSLCYKVDQKPVNPAPSLYQDDHCDVIGIWTDPATGTWYGAVNDEFQFNPWSTSNPTPAQRVATGIHYNRILMATSSDKGQTWNYQGAIVTSPYQHDGVADSTAFPANTWSYGIAGVRLFVDQASGYFYLLYNEQIKTKPGYTSFAKWFSMARAPISGKMAAGTWNKYANGSWTEPGLGGQDGKMGSSLDIEASYNAANDLVSYQGTGADGSTLNFSNQKVSSSGVFSFADAQGVEYQANAVQGTLSDANGNVLSKVEYHDPAIGATILVEANSAKKIVITVTNDAGDSRQQVVSAGNVIFQNPSTHRLYVEENRIEESIISYDTYAQRYRAVSYNGYVYETGDLSKPNSWLPVGKQPAGTTNAYLSGIDNGSLTNQNVSGRTYRTISALNGAVSTVSQVPHTAAQPVYSKGRLPSDAQGNVINPQANYQLALGNIPLSFGAGSPSSSWKIVPVPDETDPAYSSGFYRLQNSATGAYLQLGGSTAQARRAIGATALAGPALPGFDAAGNGGNGTPGGSDQWYLQPIADNVPLTLTPSSSAATQVQASKTSIEAVQKYRLVSRNSGFALQMQSSQFVLAGQNSGNAEQILSITPTS